MAFPRKAFLMQPKLKRLLTYTPNFISLLCDSWLRFRFPTSPGAVSCDGLLPPPPCAESPFAHSRCYLLWRAVLRHVGRHYPPFFALTGSWARPPPSHFLPLSPGQWVFAGYRKPLLGDGPSRRYLRIPCIGAWTPTPPRPSGVSACFFPKSIGLTSRFTSSAREIIPAMQLQQGSVLGAAVIPLCSGSHACLAPRLHLPLWALPTEQPGRLHHAMDVWLPYTNRGIATYPNQAIGMVGLSPTGMRPCRPLPNRYAPSFYKNR